MKVINVALVVKPEFETQYRQLIDQLVTGSKAELGNVDYGHYRRIGTPNEYAIIEHWQDEVAVKSHNNTPHFKLFLEKINDYVAEPLIITRMDSNE